MPKLVTGYERQQTKNLIIEHTSHLIYIKKGIQGFTVEDITRAARIGKKILYVFSLQKKHAYLRLWNIPIKHN